MTVRDLPAFLDQHWPAMEEQGNRCSVERNVVNALVRIWAASDAGEWRNRIVNVPGP
jgi:hypothetical protein